METLKFSFSSEQVLSKVPSLGVLRFVTDRKVNKIFKEEGELLIIAVRINEEAVCHEHEKMQIYFTTGFDNDKGENTIKRYVYTFEFKGEKVVNFKGVMDIELITTMQYFSMYSEDKIYANK